MKSEKKRKDRKTSKAIAERDDYKCRWCSRPGCDHAHILSRRFLLTRWVLENGIWMCREHHLLFDSNNETGKRFREYIIKFVVSIEIYKKLCEVRDGRKQPEEFGFTEIK